MLREVIKMRAVNLAVHILFSMMVGIYTFINGLMSLSTPAFDSMDTAIPLLLWITFMGSISAFTLICGLISFIRAKHMKTGTYITLEVINHGVAILYFVYMSITAIEQYYHHFSIFHSSVAHSFPNLSDEFFFIAVGIAAIVITVVNAKKLKADSGKGIQA